MFQNMVEYNVAMPPICSASLVHSFLFLLTGNTLGEIAGEKAGIFKVFFEVEYYFFFSRIKIIFDAYLQCAFSS